MRLLLCTIVIAHDAQWERDARVAHYARDLPFVGQHSAMRKVLACCTANPEIGGHAAALRRSWERLMRAYMVSGLYERGTLYDQARPSVAARKPQAGGKHMRKAHKAGAVTILRPDADGNLREAGVERSPERKRWDAAGLFVERA